ncbi:MAG: sensor domain-containing diguanylate cyclase [Chloroflexi bacterium]|nr:sensor domain-containing diguanylate cyclase [Chloroflexota bacterium]
MRSISDLSKHDLETLFDHIQAAIALVDRDGKLISWNSVFETGKRQYPNAERLQDLFLQRDADLVRAKLMEHDKEHWAGEFAITETDAAVLCDFWLIPARNDYKIFIAERIATEADAETMVGKLRKQVRLYQVESEYSKKLARNKQIEMEAVLAQAQEVAHVDPLTFLPNRRTIIKDLQSEVMRAERYRSLFSISVVDIDNFKMINDNYGHPVGDEVLRHVALLLRDSIRHPDVVGRYGGEEFIILLPNSDKHAAAEQAARLCREIRSHTVRSKDHEMRVSISIGIAEFKVGEDSWHSLLKRADNAMFTAKNNGRDRWVIGD